MMHPSVNVQIAPESVPSTPSWCGEVVLLAHLLLCFGVLKAIEEHVRLARARCGRSAVMDGVAVLLGSAMRGEPTRSALSARLSPFSDTCLALFGRSALPHPSTLSRVLTAVDQPCVEALRLLFHGDVVARAPQTSLPGGLWDRLGKHGMIVDVDGTTQMARHRSLRRGEEFPSAHHRLDEVCAPGSCGRTRGEGGRARTTSLQADTHHWAGTSSGAVKGDDRGELKRAIQAIISDATAFSIPLSQGLIRMDGLAMAWSSPKCSHRWVGSWCDATMTLCWIFLLFRPARPRTAGSAGDPSRGWHQAAHASIVHTCNARLVAPGCA